MRGLAPLPLAVGVVAACVSVPPPAEAPEAEGSAPPDQLAGEIEASDTGPELPVDPLACEGEGSACLMPDGCGAGICAGGQCEYVGDRYFAVAAPEITPGTPEEAARVARLDDGTFAVVGDRPTVGGVVYAMWGPTGELIRESTPLGGVEARTLGASGAGDELLIAVAGGNGVQLFRVSPDGETTSELVEIPPGIWLHRAHFLGEGRGVILAGTSYAEQSFVAMHLALPEGPEEAPELTWVQHYAADEQPWETSSVAELAGGGYALTSRGNNTPYGVVLLTDASGQEQHRVALQPEGIDEIFPRGVRVLDDGSVFVIGTFSISGASRGFVVRVTPVGDLIWTATLTRASGQGIWLERMVGGPDGRLRVVGGRDTAMWVSELDGYGRVVWERSVAANGGGRDLLLLEDHGLAVTGVLYGGAADAGLWLARTDAWGHVLCGRLGRCGTACPSAPCRPGACLFGTCVQVPLEGCCSADVPMCPTAAGGVCVEGACVADGFAWIPAGTVEMTPQWSAWLPGHWMALAEASAADYATCVGAGACDPAAAASGEGDRATGVSHSAAQAFCAWRGARLCSEAEWARAAERQSFGLSGLGEGPREWVADCTHGESEAGPANGLAWTEGCAEPGKWLVRGGPEARASETGDAPPDDVGIRCCRDATDDEREATWD